MPEDNFQHLMFAQDTGSAIRGAARADIYFGHGEDIPHIAGRIKQFGKFVMLVPQGRVGAAAPRRSRSRTFRCRGRGRRTSCADQRAGATPRRTPKPQAMSRDGNRRRVLSYEERVLWTTVTKAIAPLRARARIATRATTRAAP